MKVPLPRFTIGVLAAFCLTASIGAPVEKTLRYGSAVVAGIVDNNELIELSGVVSGGANKNVLWVHNDRNNSPRLYALNKNGSTVATYFLDAFNEEGTMSGDWEDIARLPAREKGHFNLCIGDIGNNDLKEKEHRILVITEPVVNRDHPTKATEIPFKTLRFQYPEGYACNSECLLFHPGSKEFIIVSKMVKKDGERMNGSLVWSFPAMDDGKTIPTAKLVLDAIPAIETDDGKVTGGDISSDGQFLILRTNDERAYLWKLQGGQSLKKTLSSPPEAVTLADEKGGEAICFSFNRSRLFTVYDGKKTDRPLHVYEGK